ncbi:3,4-dihydroxy-2-butanone 4-phosphate synthase [Acidilobus saccharovorans 345-15]|uniref:3,4-dihydroxy-2-butanone 4-phosphate synthase n=1 Tax=Acidilobus saccharovorans (strain DSM 16705 / JCM 18335 / VKM B-2471 / 345-15) TaxID=666510 RepID=D9PZS1_ACIS3|nr:3,4-dihydroxy-2-butanone-4-phosphate synthase [Acidilobus saccharovorans]ADL18559.1 3,4-dihydroxy-2-butanone 4-phosphate synthase [Acidilobus saccharovorans 345-15]
MGVDDAIKAFKDGRPVLIYDSDSRESEVDLVYHASSVTPDAIYTLRTMAGGLICFATRWSIASYLGVPWGDDLIASVPALRPLTERKLFYGDRPAFTIWVNHMSVRTGISDVDRSRTVRELYEVVKMFVSGDREGARRKFLGEFQAPGHVPLLASRGLRSRRGHTELSIALATLAGLEPATTFAEMLDRGPSLSLEKARAIAEREGLALVSGREVMEACEGVELCWSD